VVGISLFVLISSQLLGNVAVVQLAIPNVEPLNPATKRFAWAIISFVATVGGNLTITGSAGKGPFHCLMNMMYLKAMLYL